LRDIQSLVALQTNQISVESGGEDLRHLGLAHAGLALEQERALQLQREIE
jgi:hypothetical protein